jgi:hypothetical protein
MRVEAWGPLFALLALLAAGLTGMAFQYSKPHNQTEPTKAEQRNSPTAKLKVQTTPDESNKKGKDEKGWTDPLLVLFNGLLTFFTCLLYRATQCRKRRMSPKPPSSLRNDRISSTAGSTARIRGPSRTSGSSGVLSLKQITV